MPFNPPQRLQFAQALHRYATLNYSVKEPDAQVGLRRDFWEAEGRRQKAKYKMQNAKCKMQNAKCKMQDEG
jgi:hypothetical protein